MASTPYSFNPIGSAFGTLGAKTDRMLNYGQAPEGGNVFTQPGSSFAAPSVQAKQAVIAPKPVGFGVTAPGQEAVAAQLNPPSATPAQTTPSASPTTQQSTDQPAQTPNNGGDIIKIFYDNPQIPVDDKKQVSDAIGKGASRQDVETYLTTQYSKRDLLTQPPAGSENDSFGTSLVAGAVGGAPHAAASVLGFASKLGSYINPMTYVNGNRDEQNANVQSMLDTEANRQSKPITDVFNQNSTGYKVGSVIPQGILAAAGSEGVGALGIGEKIAQAAPEAATTITNLASQYPKVANIVKGVGTGAYYGGSSPITSKGSNATTGDIVKNAAVGGFLGGTVSAAGEGFGMLKNSIVGSSDVGTSVENTVKELTPTNLTPSEITALKKTGQIQTGKGITGEGWKYIPNAQDEAIAKSASPYIQQGAPTTTNIANLQNGIADLAQQTKAEIINQGDSIFNTKTIFKQLDSIEKPIMVSSDPTLNSAYDKVSGTMKSLINGSPKQYSSLLDVRKDFDSVVNRQFPNLYSSETLTPIKSAIMDMRTTLNDFIANGLPEGNQFKPLLRDQSNLYKAIDTLASKKDINMFGKFLKNPLTKPVIGAGLGGLGVGAYISH